MADIHGTNGNDKLYTQSGDDNIYGKLGNDTIYYGDSWGYLEGNDHIDGGLGQDTLVFYNGIEFYDPVPAISVDLAAGVAELSLYGSDATLTLSGIENVRFTGDWPFEAWGDGKANHLEAGYDAAVTFHGRGGNDLLEGSQSDNALYGDGGNDTLLGGGGDDTLVGGSGTDTIGYSSWDEAWDEPAPDIVVDLAAGTSTGEGSDTLAEIENVTTEDGDDWIGGSDVANVLLAGRGRRRGPWSRRQRSVEGESGDDTLHGGDGIDILLGGAGNDTLYGDAGNDTLNGGSGFDVIDGGAGIDTLTGFHHADDFVFAPGDSSIGAGFRDVVTDFSTVQGDDLDLTAFGGLTFIGQNVFSAPDQVRFIHSGGNTLVQLNTVGNSGHGDGNPAQRHRQPRGRRLHPLVAGAALGPRSGEGQPGARRSSRTRSNASGTSGAAASHTEGKRQCLSPEHSAMTC